MLESLAYSNYESPRPRPIDPAVFFDLVKIRHLIEDATDLAVRAANGTASSTLSNSLTAGNGILGRGSAAALGLGVSGGCSIAKLSKERRHRMREQATQKLSQAYQLDEIAASVATMQGTSSLEEVAKLVLQRSTQDIDAQYVHFFHEKIPSRMLAQCTTLEPLDKVIQDRPSEGSPLRTRAVTKLFKDDFVGAANDLTEALTICRYNVAQHKAGRNQLELANALDGAERTNRGARNWNSETKKSEADQPNSLETQLLFHRAGVYLSVACQNVAAALYDAEASIDRLGSIQSLTLAHERRLEARKMVRTNAKRALRDYLGFLSHFDYTPGLPAETTEDFLRKFKATAASFAKPKGLPSEDGLLEMPGSSCMSKGYLSDTLGPHSFRHKNYKRHCSNDFLKYSPCVGLPSPEVYPVSSLFSSSLPDNLSPYPAATQVLTPLKNKSQTKPTDGLTNQVSAQSEQHGALTYHPLFTDALHSLLLCHSLIQTSPKEHLRHAHMVARLARICDGYPIFLAPRSPSLADWIEILRRGNNWIGLQHSWETLCAPAPLPGHGGATKKQETEEQAKERRRQEAVLESLADERVHDEKSFRAAVTARERRAMEHGYEVLEQDSHSPKRWAQEDGKEYPICTERAEAIARWVNEAPASIAGAAKSRRAPKKGKGRKATAKCQSVVEQSDLVGVEFPQR